MISARKKIKVLIGTPIHQRKNYSMERWLKNVSALEYPVDLLLVDNSPGLDYVKKVKGYCRKYGINLVKDFGKGPIPVGAKRYRIKHLEIVQGKKSRKNLGEQIHERIARSREIIRQEFLSSDYDAYFFWENDVIIPVDALGKLVKLMQLGNFMVVDHNCWRKTNPISANLDYGIVLFNRKCMEKYSWLLEFGTDPEMPDCWYEAEMWFRRRLHKDRHNYTEVEGLIAPVYHLVG